MEQSLSPAALMLIRHIASEADALNMPLYSVGGLPRDLLLGRNSADFDLVVEGDADSLANALVSKYGGKVVVHRKFGTAKWDLRGSKIGGHDSESAPGSRIAPPDSLDLISARKETYKHPAALPNVKRGSLEDDLHRRDFTINTLAVRLDGEHFGELRDDLHGNADLETGIVRVLHPRSFIDDPTRMYRAVRYEQRYGFRIADETLALIPVGRALVDRLSAQRIRHELDLILKEARAASMLARLAELDLLKPVHASLPWDESVRARFQAQRRPELLEKQADEAQLGWLLWLLALPRTKIESISNRLHFTAALSQAMLSAADMFSDLPSLAGIKPSQCVTRLLDTPVLATYAACVAAPPGAAKQILEKYLAEWRHVKPKTTGRDLQKMGIPPGPRYQQILSRLRAAWLDGEICSSPGEEDLLRRISGDS